MAKKRKTRWVWVVVIILAVLAVAAGITAELTQKTPIQAAAVTQGSIQAYVEERARTSLPHIYHVTMPMQGRVMPIQVQEGEMVEAGQVVVHLEDIDWRDTSKQVDDILAAVSSWIKASEAQVKANKIQQAFTKWDFEKNEKLLHTGVVAERKVRDAKRSYLDSNVKVEESQAMYHATEAFQSMVKLLPSYVSRNLKRTEVKSPVTGTVLKRHVWNEKVMTPGDPLLDIGDLTRLEITADVLTELAVRIQPGDPVEIFGEAIGADTVQGSVRLVEPEAFKKISSLGVEEQRVAVKVSFGQGALEAMKNSGRTMGLHYRLRVRVITDEKQKVLRVPRTALFKGIDGGWQLYRVDQDRAVLTAVKVGLMNDHQAEIISGVKLDDTVIVAPESTISNGTRVAPIE